jgi:hypothetical protein
VIWIAWRFQRSVVCALALLALAIICVTLWTGTVQHHDLVSYMAAPCHGQQLNTPGRGDYCGELAVKLASPYRTFIRVAGYGIAPLVGVVLGLFALANEVDNRTVRLAWTQSISRTRWFAAKLGVGAALVAVILVPTAVTLSWWNGAIGNRYLFGREAYGIAGWDLVAYGLFMFALTVLVGAVVRRAGWTLAVSVILFLVVAIAVPSKVRLHLVTPTVKWTEPNITAKGSFGPEGIPYNAWKLVNGPAPRSTVGQPTLSVVIPASENVASCMNGYPMKTQREYVKAELACYKKLHVENVAVYIADDQFWTLQLREGLLYLSTGLILAGGALMLIRRIEP